MENYRRVSAPCLILRKYTGGIGGAAIAVMLEKDLGPLLIGKEMQCPETMNQMMARGIHYVARGGIAAFAISALDIAFWDVMLKQKGMGLSGYNYNAGSIGTGAEKP